MISIYLLHHPLNLIQIYLIWWILPEFSELVEFHLGSTFVFIHYNQQVALPNINLLYYIHVHTIL